MAAAPVKVNASINFVLLNNPFVAALEKNDQATMILLAPSGTQGKESITVGKMIEEVKKLLNKPDDDEEMKALSDNLSNNLKNVTSETEASGVNSIRFTIEQAFLYYEKRGEATKMEYAFSLSVDTSKLLNEVGLFTLKGASISVWNTDREQVLKQMKMFQIEDYLTQLSQPA